MRGIFLYFLIWVLPFYALSQTADIDKFTNPENKNIVNSIGFSSIVNNRIVYLHGNDNSIGATLYSANLDGSDKQELIKQNYLQSFYKVGNIILFITYYDSTLSHFLWRTDGTKAGTVMIEEINDFNNFRRPENFSLANNLLYFVTNSADKSKRLFRSDGTAAGSYILKQFTGTTTISAIKAYGNSAYFTVQYEKNAELWKTDGTIKGTYKVKELNHNLYAAAVIDSVIIFPYTTDDSGTELWRSDGTASGTYLLKDLMPGYDSSSKKQNSANPEVIGVLNGKAYFLYRNQEYNYTFGVTDGTIQGTRVLKEISRHAWHNYIYLRKAFMLNNKIGFYAITDSVGFEFYFSDTSSQTIFEPIDIWKGYGSGTNLVHYTERVTETFEGKLHYFIGNNGETGNELYRTDGTKAGTYMIEEEIPGMRTSRYSILYQDDDTMIYTYNKNNTLHLKLTLNASKIQPKKYTYSGNGLTWFRSFGADGFASTSSYYINSHALKLDKQNNSLVMGKIQSSVLRFYDTSLKVLGPGIDQNYWGFDFIAKHNSQGKLLWAKQIGGGTFAKGADLVTDERNNIYAAGCYHQKAIIDDELIESAQNSIYLTKLNADGKKIWHTSAFSTGSMDVQKLHHNGNKLILGGTYKNFLSFWPNQRLHSDSSPAYYITSFDTSGKMLWGRHLNINWNWAGPITAIKTDKSGNIYVLISGGSRNTWSSCRYNNWYFKIFCLNPETGLTEWEKTFESSDLMTASTLEINIYGELMIAGNFRGELYADDLVLKTDKIDNSCNLVSSFFLRLDNLGNTISGNTENPAFTDIYDLFAMPDGTYYETGIRKVKGNHNSYPGYENLQIPSAYQRTYIRHRSATGKLLAEKEFYKGGSDYYEHQPRVVADNEYNVYLSDIYKYSLDTISQAYNGNNNYSIYLTKFPLGQKYYEFSTGNQDNELITIGPNPTQSFLYINSTKNTFINYNVGLYNMLGQQILSQSKTDDLQTYRLNMSHLSPGVYIINLDNGSKKISKKIVKY